MNILMAVNKNISLQVLAEKDIQRIKKLCNIINGTFPEEVTKQFLLDNCKDADIIVTSWGTAALDADIIAKANNLKLMAHAAGTVKPIVSDALWDKNVKVTGGAAAIALGVAETCLGYMLIAPGRIFTLANQIEKGFWKENIDAYGGAFNLYGQQVGIIGASFVGRRLISLLDKFTVDINVFDPYLSKEDASKLGVTKSYTLDDIFSNCKIVCLNAPNTEETYKMIKGSHFAKLQSGALFINTARGEIVEENEMIEELKKGKFIACLDVTDPEPSDLDNPLRHLPNVILTPHIAGGMHDNRKRIGNLVTDEIERFINSEPLKFEITREKLAFIA
jgi:phosphoglycerate dehydrogenase-like enzyme